MRWRRREKERGRGGRESELERERERARERERQRARARASRERERREWQEKKSLALDLTTLSANQLTTYTLQDLTQLCPCTTTTNTLSPSYIITSKLTTSQVAQLAS